MKQRQYLINWAKSCGITPRTHDFSIAEAAWFAALDNKEEIDKIDGERNKNALVQKREETRVSKG